MRCCEVMWGQQDGTRTGLECSSLTERVLRLWETAESWHRRKSVDREEVM